MLDVMKVNNIAVRSPYKVGPEGLIISIEVNAPNIENCCPPPPGYNSYDEWQYTVTDDFYNAIIEPMAGMLDNFYVEIKSTFTKSVVEANIPTPPGTEIKVGTAIEGSVTKLYQNQFRKSINDRIIDPETGVVYYPTPSIAVTEKADAKIITYGQLEQKLRGPVVYTLKGQREYGYLSQDEVIKVTNNIGPKFGGQSISFFSEFSTLADEDGSKFNNGIEMKLKDNSGGTWRLRFGRTDRVNILPDIEEEDDLPQTTESGG